MAKFAITLCLLVAVTGIQGTDLSSMLESGTSTATSANTTMTTKYTSIMSDVDSVSAIDTTSSISSALAEVVSTSASSLTNDAYTRFLETTAAYINGLDVIESYSANDTSTAATNCGISYANSTTTDFNTAVTYFTTFFETMQEMTQTALSCSTNACMAAVGTNITGNTASSFTAAMTAGKDLIDICDDLSSLLETCTADND
ncbi:serine-rich adhesin for platelets-like [Neodiprion virginianus]|uniref:serine-rich adhesin for platelets-like n=1 Tax=Neodiprion virginianus TaxID=2961670 RepID=UPI001EE734DF|nr:serine-rich adhesin for platelets-like [Neodiprion virginianus]